MKNVRERAACLAPRVTMWHFSRDMLPSSSRRIGAASAILAFLWASPAVAETYQVGPGKPYTELTQIAEAELLAPGDVVEVEGDHVYAGGIHFKNSGTPEAPITVRGVRVNGKRPLLDGGAEYTVVLNGSHFVFEGFEITGPSDFCVVHKADQVTMRDSVVRDCPGNGIIGTDFESGSLTLEYVEVHACGRESKFHQIYMATDESMYPGSVFRMQHSYVHDARGGNSVKSRAERNEIYHNWIEGGLYHELDLIGPDGQDPGLAREDTDVVGNVFRKRSEYMIARMGGDGTGETAGRYRFVNNTMILAPEGWAAFYMQHAIESVEMHNNVIYQMGGAVASVYDDSEAAWTSGAAVIGGSSNWVHEGIMNLPTAWGGTMRGADPGFVAVDALELVLAEGSPLQDTAAEAISSPPGFDFPSPLALPDFVPPLHTLNFFGMASTRQRIGPLDIGAYELGSPLSAGNGGSSGPSGSGGFGSSGGNNGEGGSGPLTGSCACHVSPGAEDRRSGSSSGGSSRNALVIVALAGLAVVTRVARRRARRQPA